MARTSTKSALAPIFRDAISAILEFQIRVLKRKREELSGGFDQIGNVLCVSAKQKVEILREEDDCDLEEEDGGRREAA